MKRREFITLLGGAAAWPLAASAQPSDRMRHIGVLMSVAADDPEAPARVGAFSQGLAELGWTIGRNVRIDYRWYAGDADMARKYAVELVALAPDVVLAAGTQGVTAIQQVNRPVPVVFVGVADPVGAGFVNNLARPGGNATGFMLYEYSLSGKWLELLKQIAPHVAQVAVLRDQSSASGIGQFSAVQALAPSLGVQVSPVNARNTNRGRERGRDLRTHSERRSDRNRDPVCDSSSPDHKARRPIQAARHLRISLQRR
jgi:putative tryptophan/tyrosine transport system substrate-binding protein